MTLQVGLEQLLGVCISGGLGLSPIEPFEGTPSEPERNPPKDTKSDKLHNRDL